MKNVFKSLFGFAFVSVFFLLTQTSGAVTKTQGDFILSNRFSVEIDGVVVSGIQSVNNIESSVEVVEYKDGEDGTIHTRPGHNKPGKITISRDWGSSPEFYQWFKKTSDGKTERKSISIIFHNDAGEEAGRMNFYECFPVRWSAPELLENAKNSAHASEKLEISWETMELKAQ